jgi:hypothetical protein
VAPCSNEFDCADTGAAPQAAYMMVIQRNHGVPQ